MNPVAPVTSAVLFVVILELLAVVLHIPAQGARHQTLWLNRYLQACPGHREACGTKPRRFE